jgi:site-specific DNA-methyltransferase (adenine-specific)
MTISLIHNDCLEAMPDIPSGSVDMILADLPYEMVQCKWDVAIPFDKMWANYWRLLKENGIVVLFGAEPFSSYLRMSQMQFYRYDIIWKKRLPTGFLNAKKMPLRIHENLSVFYRKLPTYNPQKTQGHALKQATRSTNTEIYGKADKVTSYSSTERYPLSIVEYGTEKHKNPLHPTQKPVALLEYLIRTFTNEGDTVLDNVMGSGSTGAACVNTGRSFIGIEKDDRYFEIAKNRICANEALNKAGETK